MANAEILGLLYLGLLLVVVKVMEDIFGRLKLPPLLGAVLGGIILGRSVLGLVSDTPYIALFIDLGVILLLFLSGVEEFDITGIRESVSNARIYLIGAVINWIGTAAIVLTVLYFFLDVRGTELLFVSFVLGMSSVAPLSRALKDLGVSKTGTAVRTFVFTLVNYPALTDGASPPRDGDFLLLRATSIPLHPQRRFHRTEPFCNAPCGRGVTEGLLSTGFSSPSPKGTTSALTARGLYIYLFFSIKRFL